jgi:hypothetical protein
MANCMTVRTEKHQIGIGIVRAIFVYMMNFENLWILFIPTVFAECASEPSLYTSAERALISARARSLHACAHMLLISTRRRAKPLFAILSPWCKFSSACLTSLLGIGLTKYRCSRALTRAELTIQVVLDKIFATVRTLAVVGLGLLVKDEVPMVSSPMTSSPEFLGCNRFLASTSAKSFHKSELYINCSAMSSI